MNKMTVTKVRTGQENTNPAITTLVYREKSYPAREVQGKDGNYTVSVERLEQELLDGIRSLDRQHSIWTKKSLTLFGRRDPPVDGR